MENTRKTLLAVAISEHTARDQESQWPDLNTRHFHMTLLIATGNFLCIVIGTAGTWGSFEKKMPAKFYPNYHQSELLLPAELCTIMVFLDGGV